MKKILVLSLMLVLSGCACFDGMCGEDEDTATPVATTKNVYRGYDDNGYNAEKRIQNRPVYNQPQDYNRRADIYVYEKPQPRRIIYRQAEPEIIYIKQAQPTPKPIIVEAPKPAPVVPVAPKVTTVKKTLASCGDIKTTTNESTLPSTTSPCPSKVKEVREPVEIVYKKTTYKTTYEPKTTTTVTYEKQPYNQVKEEVVVQETQTAPNTVETVTTTTTTTTSQDSLDVLPPEEIK